MRDIPVHYVNDHAVMMREEDYEWLLRQAKQVIELDEKYSECRLENNHYREAYMVLEQIYKDNFVRNSYGYEDGFLDGIDTAINVIDEALEGDGVDE